jgi:hypothetical protein
MIHDEKSSLFLRNEMILSCLYSKQDVYQCQEKHYLYVEASEKIGRLKTVEFRDTTLNYQD